jgi:hypothetical protein
MDSLFIKVKIMKSIINLRFANLYLFLILCTPGIFAQLGYYKGYIVTNQNDTIFGTIGTSSKKQVIEYCILKKDGENVKYYPNMMKCFGFADGECYVVNVLKDTVVQVLVQGKLSLYRFQSTLYVQKENDVVHKLETYTEKILRNGEFYYVESIKWKGILTFLTSDCNIDPNAIKNLNLLYPALIEFVINYNKCLKSEYTEYKI